jgi:hypothetical protein
MNSMRFSLASLGLLIVTGALGVRVLAAKEGNLPQPIAWCYVRAGPVQLMRKVTRRTTGSLSLSRGTLAAVLKTESKNGRNRALVRVTNLSTLAAVTGWVDSSQVEIIPIDRFPNDQELLRQLGGEYQDELVESKVAVARWLVRQGHSGTALVCFVASLVLPASRLVAFFPAQANFIPGPSLEFPFSEMKPGILFGEVRDLLGDGEECLITREPFRQGPASEGVNLVIRRLEAASFKTLWSAPIESTNLSSFPPKLEILQPPENNAGAPGTVTKGEVEFQQRGKSYIPVWKGEVEFFAPGQDKPLKSVNVTKACAWNGSEFEPLQ